MTSTFVTLPRGADLILDVVWTDEIGAPINLTGVTLTPFEIEPAVLQTTVAVAVTSAIGGAFRITCPWSGSWPSGTGNLVVIRIKASNGATLPYPIPVVLL